MIDTADLQTFLSKIEGGAVPVDLLKIGQSFNQQNSANASGNKNKLNNGKFRLALDMEDCLDRFYGGYYSDWACGGQWNRAYQFVQLLSNAFNMANIEIIAFFDGTLRESRKQTAEQNDFRQKTISVLKHIRMIGTPPPKIWWLPPSGIRTCLRNAMRNLNIQVVQTVTDHTVEVIEYFHEFKLDGILGLNADYIIATTSRYFSSHDLRLSYKGAIETKEYLVSKVLSTLSLTPDHLPFVAVFLGGYILIDESTLKNIYKKINVDYASDLESRIKKIAEVVRNSPTNEIEEFIKHLDIAAWSNQIKESVEYYQRKGAYSNKKYLKNKKKPTTDYSKQIDLSLTAPLASETSENDEFARKILNEVNSLVDESDNDVEELDTNTSEQVNNENKVDNANAKSNKTPKVTVPFVYTLPGEVLKTSLNRHQQGIMDPRIYQLLTKKQIYLPQILEDEQYREIPSVHLFYRPARQMIYAILFNMYHQKYLCSKKDKENKQSNNNTKCELPDITISEWIWSPQNEYKTPEKINSTLLPWAVPTIQRLWFGTVFEDKQRRMKAFLSVMRSDSPLMLNRGYVPQHMLAMACVLRYIVTNPERNILTRQELDAFLATAFSPHIINIEYTQELVLPGVHLRGVYLATLFMQGIETASLANDACGVPLPWTMTNPWLFFDGKLFHLKLKMATYVLSLRELCDDHIEVVLKIERFRKAILEDVEHYLLPAHMDPLYRTNFLPTVNIAQAYAKNTIHPIANISPLTNGTTYYNATPPQSNFYTNTGNNLRGANIRGRRGGNLQQVTGRQVGNRNSGYQLKVGGVVVGSWAGGVANKPIGSEQLRFARAGAVNNRRRGIPVAGNIRHTKNQGNSVSISRTISRNTYGNKMNKNKNRRNRGKDKKPDGKKDDADKIIKGKKEETDEKASLTTILSFAKPARECTVELQNGTTVLASDLANAMCAEILKEDNENRINIKKPPTSDTSDILNNTTASPENASTPTNNSVQASQVQLSSNKTNNTPVSVNKTENNKVNGNNTGKNKKKNKKGKAAVASTEIIVPESTSVEEQGKDDIVVKD